MACNGIMECEDLGIFNGSQCSNVMNQNDAVYAQMVCVWENVECLPLTSFR